MKAIAIRAKPVFVIELDSMSLGIMRDCAATHYDRTCRAANEQGGVLYGWANMMEAPFGNSCMIEVVVEWRDLDLVLKILEGGQRWDMMREIIRAMDAATRILPTWTHRLDGEG